MKYQIKQEKCTQCGACQAMCPNEAIIQNADGTYSIDQQKCQGCGTCKEACMNEAIAGE